MDENRVTIIKPHSGWLDLHLGELAHYKDLIFLFVKRNFVSLYKQTVLGPAWAVIQPLLTTVVFSLVFGRARKQPQLLTTPLFSFDNNTVLVLPQSQIQLTCVY